MGISNILNQQSAVARVNQQISNGKRMQTAADDPSGWAHSLSLNQALADLDRYQTNANTARQRLNLEENTLSSSSDVISRVRELAIQANGAQGAVGGQAIVAELNQLKDQLLAYANTKDANGSYLFAGSDSASSAFSSVNGTVIYNGDQNKRLLEIGPGRSMADGDSGDTVYAANLSGNGTFNVSAAAANTGTAQVKGTNVIDRSLWDGGNYTLTFNAGNYQITDSSNAVVASGAYTAGNGIRFRGIEVTVSGQPANGDQMSIGPSQQKDVFAMLDDLISLVKNPATTDAQRAQFQTGMFNVQSELSTAFDTINNVRTSVGTRLAALDDADNSLATQTVTLKSTLSSVEDVDLAQASSELSKRSLMLQAAQMAYAKVQGLSLFQYLK
jgi:flagellar hook-associated protein 3 FlgL